MWLLNCMYEFFRERQIPQAMAGRPASNSATSVLQESGRMTGSTGHKQGFPETREIGNGQEGLVAGGGFEPPTFGL